MQFVFQISKLKILQITILSLKFEFVVYSVNFTVKVHIFWEGHKFYEISTIDLTVTTWDKSRVNISQNFAAFSEYMNFKNKFILFFLAVSIMSAEIAWAVTRNNSAFLLKKRNCPKPFSTDPMNLTNKHSQRYTGLVNKKAVAVAPAADNKGFTVTIKGGKGSCF